MRKTRMTSFLRRGSMLPETGFGSWISGGAKEKEN